MQTMLYNTVQNGVSTLNGPMAANSSVLEYRMLASATIPELHNDGALRRWHAT